MFWQVLPHEKQNQILLGQHSFRRRNDSAINTLTEAFSTERFIKGLEKIFSDSKLLSKSREGKAYLKVNSAFNIIQIFSFMNFMLQLESFEYLRFDGPEINTTTKL